MAISNTSIQRSSSISTESVGSVEKVSSGLASSPVRSSHESIRTTSSKASSKTSGLNAIEYLDSIDVDKEFEDIWDRRVETNHPYSTLNKKRVQRDNQKTNERVEKKKSVVDREFSVLKNRQFSLKGKTSLSQTDSKEVNVEAKGLLSDKNCKERLEFWKKRADVFYAEAKRSQGKLTDLVKEDYNPQWILVETHFDKDRELRDITKLAQAELSQLRKELKEIPQETEEVQQNTINKRQKLLDKIDELEKIVVFDKDVQLEKQIDIKRQELVRTRGQEAKKSILAEISVLRAKQRGFLHQEEKLARQGKPEGQAQSLEQDKKQARSARDEALTESLNELVNLKMASYCLDQMHIEILKSESISSERKRSSEIAERAKLLNSRTHIVGALFDVQWIYIKSKDVTKKALIQIEQAAQEIKTAKSTLATVYKTDAIDINQVEENIDIVRAQNEFIKEQAQKLDELSSQVTLSNNEKKIIADVNNIQQEADIQAQAAEADYRDIYIKLDAIKYEAFDEIHKLLSHFSVRASQLFDHIYNIALQAEQSPIEELEQAAEASQAMLTEFFADCNTAADLVNEKEASQVLVDICNSIETNVTEASACLRAIGTTIEARKLTEHLQQLNELAKIAVGNAKQDREKIISVATLGDALAALASCQAQAQAVAELYEQAFQSVQDKELTQTQINLLDEINANKTRAEEELKLAKAEIESKFVSADLLDRLKQLENDVAQARDIAEAAANQAQASSTDELQTQAAITVCQAQLTAIVQAQEKAKTWVQNKTLTAKQEQLITNIELNRVAVSSALSLAKVALVAKQALAALTARLGTLRDESNQVADSAQNAAEIANDINADDTQTQNAVDTCQQAVSEATIIYANALDETKDATLTSGQKKLLEGIEANKSRAEHAHIKALEAAKNKHDTRVLTERLKQLADDASKARSEAQLALSDAQNASTEIAETQAAIVDCQNMLEAIEQFQTLAQEQSQGSELTLVQNQLIASIEADRAAVSEALEQAHLALADKQKLQAITQRLVTLKVQSEQVLQDAENAAEMAKDPSANEAQAQENVDFCLQAVASIASLYAKALDEVKNITPTQEQKALLGEIEANQFKANKALEVAKAQAKKKHDLGEFTLRLAALKNDTQAAKQIAESALINALNENIDLEQTHKEIDKCQDALNTAMQARHQASDITDEIGLDLTEQQSKLLSEIANNNAEVLRLFSEAQSAFNEKIALFALNTRLTTLKEQSEQALQDAKSAADVINDPKVGEIQTKSAVERCLKAVNEAASAYAKALDETKDTALTLAQRKLLGDIEANKSLVDKAYADAIEAAKNKTFQERLKQLENDTTKARISAQTAADESQDSLLDEQQIQECITICQAALATIVQIQTQVQNEAEDAQLTSAEKQLIVNIQANREAASNALAVAQAALVTKQAATSLTAYLTTLKNDAENAADGAEAAVNSIDDNFSTEAEVQAVVDQCTKFVEETNKYDVSARVAIGNAKINTEQQVLLTEIEICKSRAEAALAAAQISLVFVQDEKKEISMYHAFLRTLYEHLDLVTEDIAPSFLPIYVAMINKANMMANTQLADISQHFVFAQFKERNKETKIGSTYTVKPQLNKRANLANFITVYEENFPQFYVRPDLMTEDALVYATHLVQMNMVQLLSGTSEAIGGQRASVLDKAQASDGLFTRGHIAKAVQAAGSDFKHILMQEALEVIEIAVRKCKEQVEKLFELSSLDQISSDEIKKLFLLYDTKAKIKLNDKAIEKLKLAMDQTTIDGASVEFEWANVAKANIIQSRSILKVENSLLEKELETRAIMLSIRTFEEKLQHPMESFQQRGLEETIQKEAARGLSLVEAALVEIDSNRSISDAQKAEKKIPFEKMQRILKKEEVM